MEPLILFRIGILVTAITFFLLGVFVYFNNRNNIVNRYCLFGSIAAAWWAIGFYNTLFEAYPYKWALFSSRCSHAAVWFISMLFYKFLVTFIDKDNYKKNKFIDNISICLISACAVLTVFTPLFIKDVVHKSIFPYYPNPGILYPLLIICYVMYFSAPYIPMVKHYRYAEPFKKIQIKFLFIAATIGWTAGLFLFPLFYNIIYVPYPTLLMPLFPLITTYAILRHKLMDIEVIIKKTLIFASIFAGVYGIFALVVFLIPYIRIPGFQMAWAIFTVSSLMTGLTGLVSIYILFKYGSKKVHYILGTFNIFCTVFWGFGAFFISIAKDSSAAIIFWKIALFGGIFASTIFYHVIIVLGELRRHIMITILYCFAGIFYFLTFFDLAGIKIVTFYNSMYYIRAIDFRWPILISIWFVIALSSLVETYNLCNKTYGFRRTQFQYLMIGATIGWTGALIDILPFFGINAYPVGNVLIWIYCTIITYAIVRHQLMDIEIVIKKTVVFAGIFASVYVLFAVFTFYGPTLIKSSRLITIIPSLLIVILMYKPMERLLINITDKYLFQKKYDYKELLKVFTEEVLTVLDLNKLVKLTVDKLVDIVRVSACSVLLVNRENIKYYIAANHNMDIKEQEFTKSADEVKTKLGAELVMPMILNNKSIGMIALGRKKSDEAYTKDDIDILQSLAKTLAIAVSNAELFDELAKTQAEAAQKEKMAVIGTLAAGMAHEIRNPITTIKTFAEFFNEKKDDPEFIKKFQKLVPREIEKINDMITHLLEYSKPADYKSMEQADLKETLNEVLELLKTEMALNDIILKDRISIVPLVHGNKKYIQEVFFNLIQNAIHAIGRRGEIHIDAVESAKYVDILIKDTGCGITDDNLKQIFEPFFTTKMDATGVGLGLYVIKQLMTRMDGSISVESKMGAGTTFRLRFNKAPQ